MCNDHKTVDRSPMVKTAIFMFATSGFWCPLWWSTKWKFRYKFYSYFMRLALASWMLSQVICVSLNVTDIIKLSTTFQTFISGMGAVCNATNILVRRQNIIVLLSMFEDDYCRAQDSRDIDIQRKYAKMYRWIDRLWSSFAIVALICITLSPFVNDLNARVLPFLIWFPYKIDSELTFWCSYFYECWMAFTVGLLCVGNDLLVVSIMTQISCQLDILSHRLAHMTRPRKEWGISRRLHATVSTDQEDRRRELIGNVHHHRFIFKLGEVTQRSFVPTFAFQMCVTLVGSCTSAYLFSRFSFGSPPFNSALLIVTGLVTEAFLYCWFGNEVHLKSLEVGNAVYNMDWTDLDVGLRKELLNVSRRSGRPILFTSGPAMALSNEVYVGILKASYTAFTVLQRIGVRASSIIESVDK